MEIFQLIEEKDGKLILNEEIIDKVFGDKELTDINVAILPIIGTERYGKSFTLNYFMRYLMFDSLGKEDQELNGFGWKSGTVPQTKGIYIWREQNIRTINNKKYVVILMDTQGSFGGDHEADGIIIPFSLAVSTLTVYNVMKDLNSNDLQPFEMFLRRADCESSNREMNDQKLMILVRDWTHDDNYGFSGGKYYLRQKMNGKDNEFYKFIESQMHSTLCYLMPPPVNKMNGNHFRGSLSELDQEFKANLNEVFEKVIQEIYLGTKLKGSEMGSYIKHCFKAIQKREPFLSLFEASLSHELTQIVRQILDETVAQFNELIIKEKIELNLTEFIELRNNLETRASEVFEQKTAERGSIYDQKKVQLETDLEITLNKIEMDFLSILCYECLRKLCANHGKELDIFVNKGFLGNLFTRRSKLEAKSKELEEMVDKELEKYPELKKKFTNNSLIDFTDNLNDSLQKIKGRQIKTGFNIAITTSLTLMGGLIGLALGAGSLAIKEGTQLGKSAVSSMSSTKSFFYGVFSTIPSMIDSLKLKLQNINLNLNGSQSKFRSQRDVRNEAKFLEDLKYFLILINRYLIIGGDLEFLTLKAKEAEKKYEKKRFFRLLSE